MYKIDPGIVIANYFGEFPKKTELTVSMLAAIKNAVDTEFLERGKFLEIDLCRDALGEAVNPNNPYFSFDESQTVIRFDSSHGDVFYEDVYGIFNAKLDPVIKYELLVILDEVLQKLHDD